MTSSFLSSLDASPLARDTLFLLCDCLFYGYMVSAVCFLRRDGRFRVAFPDASQSKALPRKAADFHRTVPGTWQSEFVVTQVHRKCERMNEVADDTGKAGGQYPR